MPITDSRLDPTYSALLAIGDTTHCRRQDCLPVVLTWSADVDAARWWIDQLHPFAQDVGSIIPGGFEAYARVLHPIRGPEGPETWAALAADNGRIIHAEVQLHALSASPTSPLGPASTVDWGSLPRVELDALMEVLASHTASAQRCWYCVWEGYGQLHGGDAVTLLTRDGAPGEMQPLVPDHVRNGPRVSIPHRSYYLLSGVLADARDLYDLLWWQSPNIWWPDNRAWIVATEIDFAWTYIAGSQGLIDSVIGHPALEALRATPLDRCTYDGDTINGA